MVVVGRDIFCYHKFKGVVDLIVKSRCQALYFALYCTLKHKEFVGGSSLTFSHVVLWFLMVSEKDVVTKLLTV